MIEKGALHTKRSSGNGNRDQFWLDHFASSPNVEKGEAYQLAMAQQKPVRPMIRFAAGGS
jgi:hypothetical protein